MDFHSQMDIEAHSKDLKRIRENVQKKTFERWTNRFLSEPNYRVANLLTDLRDGRRLIRLVEILQKVSIGRPNQGSMRVQRVDNVSRALDVLRSTRKRIRDTQSGAVRDGQPIIVGIGNENIVDGDVTLTLGLIWQMIRHYHIAMIAEELATNNQDISKEAKSINDALLLWCQQKTKGYPNCKIQDFHKSWNDGMAFNALLHAHRPEAFDYNKLRPADKLGNLNHAFDVASDQFGVAKLLDAEDVAVDLPDEKSIIIYVTDLYSALNKAKTEETGSKRVTNFLNDLNKTARNVQRYEANVDELFAWIKRTVGWLSNRDFPNSIAGLQEEKRKFNTYLLVEKFEKFGELTNLEVLLYDIQTLQRKEGHRVYAPKDGKTLEDLGEAWAQLEDAEQAREKALVSELLKQLELEKRARHFTKVMLPARLKTLGELSSALADMRFNEDSMKDIEDVWERLVGIQSAILNQKEIRFEPFYKAARRLIEENYHDKESIAEARDDVHAKWDQLMEAFKAKEAVIKPYADIVAISKEVDALRTQLLVMRESLPAGKDAGVQLYDAEDLLARHYISEQELLAVHDQIDRLNGRAKNLFSARSQGTPAMSLSRNLFALEEEYQTLMKLFAGRRADLELSRDYYQFMHSCEDEEAWLAEKRSVLQADVSCKDLRSARKMISKLKVEEAELSHRRTVKFAHLCAAGEEMQRRLAGSPDKQKAISNRLAALRKDWEKLQQLLRAHQVKVTDIFEAQQFYAAANEAEDYMNGLMPVVRSRDVGEDVGSARALLKRLGYLREELDNFGRGDNGELTNLRRMATLLTEAADKHKIDAAKVGEAAAQRSEANDAAEAEEEEEDPLVAVEEPYEETVIDTRVEDAEETRRVQRIMVTHAYEARDPKQRDLSAEKGDVFELVQKTNNDWYSVRDVDTGKRGFLPAIYLAEISPATVTVKVPKTVEVERKVAKTRTVYKRASEISAGAGAKGAAGKGSTSAAGRRKKAAGLVRQPSLRTAATLHADKENIAKRMGEVDMQFEQLVRLADGRAGDLQDSAKQYQFFQLADAFQAWLTDKEAVFGAEESLADNSAAIKKRYEKHFQEIMANKARLDEIDQLAGELLAPRAVGADVKSAMKAGAGSVVDRDRVKTVHKDIMTRWERLNKLKIAKEKKLADSSSIERFAKRAQEAKDQLEEKRDLLAEFADLGFDQAANAGLVTRHKNLLRDLDLLRKRVAELDYEGRAIKEVHPSEAAFIDDKLAQLHKLLDEVTALANKRDADLENKREKLALDAAAKKAMDELEDATEAVLSGTASLPDSASRKRRPTLGDISDEDIAHLLAQTEDLEKAVDKLLEKNPNDPQLLALKAKLKARRQELEAAQAKRKRERDNAENLRKFLQSADQLLTKLNSVDTRLGNLQPADTPDQLRAQLSELESAAAKLEQYAENAEDLADRGKVVRAACQPADAEKVDQRLRALDDAVVKAKSRCHAKRDELQAAAEYAKFKERADELAEWLAEKRIAAEDQSHRDLANLPSKKQRHRAFESELAAHKPTLDGLRKDAADMQAKKHPKSPQAKAYMDQLEKAWQDLEAKTGQKGAEIDEALQEQELLRELDECGDLLDKLDREAGRTDDGKDLRSARDMLEKQKSMEASLGKCGKQLADLAKRGDSLAKRGHYDADKIQQAVRDRQAALDKLDPKMAQRRAQLEEALAFRQLEFDKEREAQWIDEHTPRQPQDGQTDWLGRSLDEAQMLKQKHGNLQHEVDNHRPAFDKVLSAAKQLSNADGRYAKPSAELAANLRNRMDRLNQSLAARDRQLLAAVAVQQYAADLGDLDQRLADNALVLSTLPEAKDPAAVDKNLKKLAALEEELASVRGQLTDLGKRRDQLSSAPELDWLVARHADLEAKLADLSKRSRAERKELSGRRDYWRYLQDVSDAREWIDTQLMTAASQDFGTDFDHCKQLQAAFDQFAANVAPGQVKVAALTSRAEALISGGNPNAADILKKSRDLEDYWGQLAACLDSREKNLAKALEIHEYNKDVSEFCQRLDEKKRSIPTEVGRDLDALDKHTKKHALFVEELGLLDESLQELRARADDLKAKLDKDNSERVADRQQVVEDKFEELEELQKARVRQLEEAHDFFAFMKQKQAVKSWIDDGVLEIDNLMSRPVQPDEIVGFCDRAAEMSDQLRSRLGDVKQLAEEGESLCDRESDFSDEIGRAVDDVISMKETVEDRLARLADYLACLRAFGDFADKTQPLVKTMNKLEHRVSIMPAGNSLEQVAKLSQDLDALRVIYDKNSPRLAGCQEAAAKAAALMRAGHPLLEQVNERLKSTEQLVTRVGAGINRTRAGLADQRCYLAFVVDNIELCDFVKAQQALVAAATSSASGSSKSPDADANMSKSEQLLRLQDRKDAVDGHRDRIEAHIASGREMVAGAAAPSASAAAKTNAPDVSERVRRTADEWAKLQRLCADQEVALESARTFLRFLEDCDKAQAAVLKVKPLLDSYKSDQRDTQLDNYLYDALQQLTVDQDRIDRLKAEAAVLLRDRPADDPDAAAVQRRCDKVVQLWAEVRPRLALCRQELAAKVKFHRFCNTADQLHGEMARLTESLAKAVQPGRYTDPKAVGELIKRNNAIRDTEIKKFAQLLVPLKEIMEEFQAASIYPQTRQTCADLESELDHLRSLCSARDRQLQDERRFAAFVDGVGQFCAWTDEFEKQLAEEAAQASLTSEVVEQRQARNRDRETEVGRQLESAEYLRGRGADLAGLSDAYAEAVAEPRDRLEAGRKRLKASFDRQTRDLADDAAYVTFLEAAQRLRRGLQSLDKRLREPGALPLHSELRQLRDSLDDCEAAHDERLAGNRHLADYQDEISQLRSLADSAAELNDAVAKRHAALDKLTAYLQHCDNYQSRLDAKRVTIVEPFDEADVNRKLIEKFATLQTEVQGYSKQLDQLAEEGNELCEILEPQNQQVVTDRLEELRRLLATADDRCSAQLSLARDAYAVKQLLQRCEDLDQFCQNSEDVIEANSTLDSLARAKQAQKDLSGLKADLNSREESLAEVESGLAALKSDRARAQFDRLSRRFAELRSAASLHGENIQHAVKVFRFLAEAQDEIAWIGARTPLVDGADVGDSSADVQRLTRRLKQFEEEYENRRPVIDGVVDVGQALLESSSSEAYRKRSGSMDSMASGSEVLLFREDETRRKLSQLQSAYSSLTRLTKERAERLEAARVRFAYLDDLAEAKSWIEEKLAGVRTLDPGADQFVCLSRCKTVETLAADVEKVEERVAELAEVAKQIDESTVYRSQAEVQNLLDSLSSLLKQHKRRLEENLKYFAFKEQVDEFDSWLRSQQIVLKSIEPGSDEESCDRAIEKCSQAQSALRSRQAQQDQIDSNFASLQSEKNCRLDEAKALRDAMKTHLANVHLSARDLQKSLLDSKKIHKLLYEAGGLHEALDEKLHELQSLSQFGVTLTSNEELLRGLNLLTESELRPLGQRRDELAKKSRQLMDEFKGTDAERVINEDVSAVERLWQELTQAAEEKRADLLAAKDAHTGLLKFADLLQALQQLLNQILAEDLAPSYKLALEQVERSAQRGKEAKQRESQAHEFARLAAKCRRDCPFMSDFIDAKQSAVSQLCDQVLSAQKRRHELYTENADIRRVLDGCQRMNRWLDDFGREFGGCAPGFEHGLDQLETRGKRSEELTALLTAQKPRVDALTELTLLERRFEEQKRTDSAKRSKSMAYNELTAGVKKRETMRQQHQQPHTPPISEEGAATRPRLTRPQSVAEESASASAAASAQPARKRGLNKTHTFNTKKTSGSGKSRSRLSDLLPPSIEGELEVRQDLQAGGQKFPIKKWKKRFAALCGHQLAVFKDRNAAQVTSDTAQHTLMIYGCRCEMDEEHRNTLRLHLRDGSLYLLMLPSAQDCLTWQGQIRFKASLEPSRQLAEIHQEANEDIAEGGGAAEADQFDAEDTTVSLEVSLRDSLGGGVKDASVAAASPRPASQGPASTPGSPAAAAPVPVPAERKSAAPRAVSVAAGTPSSVSTASSGKTRAAQLRAAEGEAAGGRADSDSSSDEEPRSPSGQVSQTLPRVTVSADVSGESAELSAAQESKDKKKSSSLFRMFSGRKKKEKESKKGGN